MKKIKCKVCDHEFDLTKDLHYIARGDGKNGLAAFSGGDETRLYDAFDCPACGCQIIIQERKRTYEYGNKTGDKESGV